MVRRRQAVRILTGVEELDSALNELSIGVANRVTRSAVNAGLRVGVKAMKRKAPYASVKRSFGSRLKKVRKGSVEGKMGAGVGRQKAPTGPKTRKSGVGMSAQNIHWFILGSKNRYVKTSRGKNLLSPRWAGRMPVHPIVKEAVSGALPEIRTVMIETAKKQLEKEAAKLAR